MATLTDEERAAKAAKARAQLAKYRKNKASTATAAAASAAVSRPESIRSGVTSPALSDNASLPTTGPASPIPPSAKHGKAASEVPDSLFSSSATAADDFFASPPPPSLPSLAEDEPPPITSSTPVEAAAAPRSPPTLTVGSPAKSTAGSELSSHQQTINLLVNEKAQLAKELDELQTSLDEREAQVRSSTSDAERQWARLAEVEASLTSERGRIAGNEKAQAELRDRLAALEREASVASHSAQELRDTIENRETTIASLREQLAADTKLHDLESRLKAKTTHADTLESEVSKLRTSLHKLKADKEVVDADVVRLREASTTATSAQQERDAAHAALVAELASAKTAIQAAERSSQSQITELESLRASSSTSTADLASVRSELASLRRSLTTAQESLASAESRASQATARRDGLQSDNDALVAQVQELREKTVSLTNDHLTAKERGDTLHRNVRDREAELKRSKAAEEEASGQVKAIEAQLAERDRQLTAARERAERAEHDAQYVQDDATAREAEIAKLREKLGKADTELAKIRVEGESRVSDLTAVQGELEGAKAEVEREREERAKLEADLAQMRESAAELQGQIEELKEAKDQPAFGSVPPSATAFSKASPTAQVNGHVSPASASLDELRSQHDLELSGLRSEMRTLEGKAFDEQGRSHGLQRQVEDLQADIVRLEGLVTVERERALKAMKEAFAVGAASSVSPLPTPLRSPPQQTLPMLTPSRLAVSPSPSPGSSAGSRAHRRARTEFAISPGTVTAPPEFPFPSPTPSPRPPVTTSAPPRRAAHARRVSLNLLKNRMEDELGLPNIALIAATPETPAYHDEHDHRGEEGRFSGDYGPRTPQSARPRAQLGDDLIWCASCSGDLLVV